MCGKGYSVWRCDTLVTFPTPSWRLHPALVYNFTQLSFDCASNSFADVIRNRVSRLLALSDISVWLVLASVWFTVTSSVRACVMITVTSRGLCLSSKMAVRWKFLLIETIAGKKVHGHGDCSTVSLRLLPFCQWSTMEMCVG